MVLPPAAAVPAAAPCIMCWLARQRHGEPPLHGFGLLARWWLLSAAALEPMGNP